ncbi:preprotein translocase subunit YajC [Cellulomonas sp. ATA003]|uniref:preprotein translocase subunit YajC n=1 Tax=Cellulomonas sp. ATA003 TaxID=3073064 RepID=UPI00287310D4|nr:preprotein translocase subunit YajC [Cellulomonas sp. ATA003]WNB87346.1 preprotein translocase subunit YajC [Cellulomonas sp. ATA003]
MDPSFLIILLVAFGAMWLMTSRTRKQQREAADFRANLEVGQEVMTGSGLYGTIVAVDGDTITLESTPGNETRWIRAAIAKLVPPTDDAVADEEYEDDEATDEYADEEYVDEYADGTDADVAYAETTEVPDDLSTLKDRRTDDGPENR